MADAFTWDGNTLCGPYKLLVGDSGFFPGGPPLRTESHPTFWKFAFRNSRGRWVLNYQWRMFTGPPQDLVLRWKVGGPANASGGVLAETIDQITFAGPAEGAYGSSSMTGKDWNFDEHLAAGSRFEMTVQCPSLAGQAGKASVSPATDLLYGKWTPPGE